VAVGHELVTRSRPGSCSLSLIEFCSVVKNALIEIASKLLYRSNLFLFCVSVVNRVWKYCFVSGIISQRSTDLYNVRITGTDATVVAVNEQ